LKKNEKLYPYDYSCKCIRQIVGKIYRTRISMALAAKLRNIVGQCFEIDDKTVAEIMADYYLELNEKIDPYDFSELIRRFIRHGRPIDELRTKLYDFIDGVIGSIHKMGWNIKDVAEVFKIGTINFMRKKRGK